MKRNDEHGALGEICKPCDTLAFIFSSPEACALLSAPPTVTSCVRLFLVLSCFYFFYIFLGTTRAVPEERPERSNEWRRGSLHGSVVGVHTSWLFFECFMSSFFCFHMCAAGVSTLSNNPTDNFSEQMILLYILLRRKWGTGARPSHQTLLLEKRRPPILGAAGCSNSAAVAETPVEVTSQLPAKKRTIRLWGGLQEV